MEIFRWHNVSVTTRIRIVQTMVSPVTLYGNKSWTLKKSDKKNIDAFEFWRILRISWTVKTTSQWIIEQINTDVVDQVQIIQIIIQIVFKWFRLLYFRYIMQSPDSLEKALMLGKVKGKR